MKKNNYLTTYFDFREVTVAKTDLWLVYLLYLISVVTLWRFSDYFPGQPDQNSNDRTYLSSIAACEGTESTNATISPTGSSGLVPIPVGSRTSGLKRWSDLSVWPNRIKPGAADDVIIPANTVLVLDENVTVKSITVKGQLIMDIRKNLAVNTEYIMVMGTTAYFEWGTPTEPYLNKGIITLLGNDPTKKIPGTSPQVESKAIMVMDGALMELHGKAKTSWTNLTADVTSGNMITVANAINWEIGDEILIAPSRLSENEGEKRTITAISADKKTLTLNAPLQYPHFGQIKNYTRSRDGKTWTGDMRAEVGLLSKNIKIQGDAGSETSKFGGHIMIHFTGRAHVDGIELFRMGQKAANGKGILGRYPFHWHLVQENGAGQYFKNSSVHISYNRAITIHGTESTVVENNFCYDHVGHGLFLEDGSERFNTIRGNVVLLTRRPPQGQQIVPSDNQMNTIQNRTPASFWITNPNNIFENNVAAGTEGTGFWFALPQRPMGPSAQLPRFSNLAPYQEPLGRFKGNKAHSCASGFDIFDQLAPNDSILANGAWQRTDLRIMDGSTFYACDLAVYGGIGGGRQYVENVIFRNSIFLDNVTSIMHANYSLTEESAFIANSGANVFTGERFLNRGYDGACSIKNCHLVGWQASNANYVQNTGGAQKHVNYRVSGITKDHQGPPRMAFPDYSKTPKGEVGTNAAENPRFWSYVHWDMDGSLGGKANTSIITNHPLCRDGSEVRYDNWTNLYRTDRRFAYMILDFPGDPHMTLVRTKAGTPKAGQYYINGYYGTFIHFPVIVNDGFLYTMQFEALGTSKSFALHMKDDYVAGDEVIYRIKDFGKFGGIAVSGAGAVKAASLTALQTNKQTAYVVSNGDLYIKMVSIASTPDIVCTVSWTSSITLPKLDTDNDGISDLQESINGTDPIPNDPIRENPPLASQTCTASITAPANSICPGGSVLMTASTGASYKWLNGNTQVATTATYTATTAGSYTVEVTNAQGCKAVSSPFVITAAALPTAAIISSSTVICAGSSLTLTASPGAAYRWFNGSTQVATTASYAATTAGSYTVEVTNAQGCKAISPARLVTLAPAPVAIITSAGTSMCPGGSILLTASPGSSYRWLNGTTQVGTASSFTATTAGSYTVEVTNTQGCKAVSSAKVITVSPLPVATITGASNSICPGSSLLLTASTGTSYKWLNGTTQVATTATYTATAAGSYTVEVTNASGCKATSAPYIVSITPSITWYQDSDGDGKGDPTKTVSSCTKPLGYVSVAGDACPTDPLKIAAGNCGCNKLETSCGTSDPSGITGPTCGKPLQQLSFTLDASMRTNATGYSWWFTGSSDAVIPTADATGATVKLSQYFTSGQVCVGINLSLSPYYKQTCKSITQCAAKMGEEDFSAMTASEIMVYPNPSNTQYIIIDASSLQTLPEKIELINALGEVVLETKQTDLQTSISTAGLMEGTYYVKTYFTGTNNTQKLVIIK